MPETPPLNTSRLAWACRRGTLELDLLLSHYLTHHYPQASPQDQQCFQRLVSVADESLNAWLTEGVAPDDPALASIVKQVLAAQRA